MELVASSVRESVSAGSGSLSPRQLVEIYRLMLLSRRVDDREILLKRQQKIYFQISGAGHEALGVGAATDPASGGRQMPAHYGSRALNIVSVSASTSTQVLHAVGCAEAGRYFSQYPEAAAKAEGDYRAFRDVTFHGDEVAYASVGEGSTSQGEFWEAMNTASNKKLPVVF